MEHHYNIDGQNSSYSHSPQTAMDNTIHHEPIYFSDMMSHV